MIVCLSILPYKPQLSETTKFFILLSVHSHDSYGMDFEVLLIYISKLEKVLKTLKNRLPWEDSTATYIPELIKNFLWNKLLIQFVFK